MSKQLATFLGIGLLVIIAAILGILYSTKGSHLELKGQIIKIRTGAIDENSSAAVLDFRVENVSDIPFVVRIVKISAEKDNGDKIEGALVSKPDLKMLLDFNKFLGGQYNEALSIRDKIAPHQVMDRMAAARFEVPQAQLEAARQIHLYIQDMDGPEFETAKSLK